MEAIRLNTASVLVVLSCVLSPAYSQPDYGTRLGVPRGSGETSYAPYGPGVLFDALDPAIKKWYVPQELYNEYRWRPVGVQQLRPQSVPALRRYPVRGRLLLRPIWQRHHPWLAHL